MNHAQAKGISLRFKARASGASQIMSNGRGKDTMGATSENVCLNWILEQPEFFDRRVNDFSTGATKKGNAVERDSLDFIGVQLYGGEFLEPNTDHFSDNFIMGTPDLLMPDHIIDNKASWTVKTFPFFDTTINKTYWLQGQVYMRLTGRKKYKLIYTLMNTPESLIQSECYKVARELGYAEPSAEIEADVRSRMTYDSIDPSLRLRVFEFGFHPEAIEQIEKRVEQCREFIYNTLILMPCL